MFEEGLRCGIVFLRNLTFSNAPEGMKPLNTITQNLKEGGLENEEESICDSH
jgi:hypothetical protein